MRCTNILTLALAASLSSGILAAADDGVAWVDFSQKEAKLKPALQGSSWAIRLARWPGGVDDERLVTNLHTYAVRTHDGPCANEAISVGDVPYMFPLMHLDAKDPRNYSFVPTDAWLEKNVNAGFTLGNDGRFKTYPPEKPFKALDNIIVRGLKLRNFKVWMRGDLSDHALVSAELELE